MRITSIETIPVRVPIEPRRAIVGGRGAHMESPFLVLRVHTDEGLVGLGEAACTPGWSGEDQVTAAHVIERYVSPAVTGEDPLAIARVEGRIRGAIRGHPFARSAVEMALWDIAGKAAGLPLHRLLGGPVRECVATKLSITGVEPERAAEVAAWAVEAGFTALKVKVGRDPATDLARVAAVRERVGEGVAIGVDANGGWPPWRARETMAALRALGVGYFEQPVAPGDPAALAELRAEGLVVADESVYDAADLMAVIRARAADAVSLYVGKGGGVGALRTMAGICEAAGLAGVVGSNLELGIGSAAMLHAAAALPGIRPDAIPCDIVSPFFNEDDLLAEPLDIKPGAARPPEGPGLGVELDEAKLARYRVDR